MDRITKYLIAEDIELDHIKRSGLDAAIKVKNGNFYWLTEEEKDKIKKEKETGDKKKEQTESLSVSTQNNQANTGYKLILEDINLNIKKGSFVAILGE